MVRVGGLTYSIDPTQDIGKRITDMEVNGMAVKPNKTYLVAGWASMEPQTEGKPVWDIVAVYLRHKKTVKITAPNLPKIKGVGNNPGLGT